MGIDITQWRVEIAKYWKYVGRRRHSRGKSQAVKTASATSCNPLLVLMLAFCLITAPSLLLVAGDVERNPGPPKLEKVESKLNIDDLGEVWEAVFTARTKSFKIGLKLRIPVDTLDSIATQFTDPGDRLLQTLKVWLKTATKPTWQAIVGALRNATIGEVSLATDIEAKYCTAVESGQAGGQTMSEVQPTATDIQLQTLQEELKIKDQQLRASQRHRDTLQQESQRRMDTLQQELRQIQQQAVKDKQDGQRQLQELTLQLQSMKQQPQETIIELKQQLQQTQQQMEGKQHAMEAREGQLRELQLQLQEVKLAGAQEKSVPRPRQELQQAQQVEEISGGREGQLQKSTQQLQPMKQTAIQPQKALMQQKTMKWQKESKAPEKMLRGSAASDSNMAYFNGEGSTKVYSYDSDTHKWHRLPDTPYKNSTLMVVQHILTMVGGYPSGKVTNSLFSLMGEGGATKWFPLYPAMPTARRYAAAVCSGHSLIIAGGKDDGYNSLATVEVLDIDTKQWSTACSLPHPFSEATISICGENVYMAGGKDKTRSVLTCSVHELLQCQTQPLAGKLRTAPAAKQTTKWQKVADSPYYHSSCATLCGQLVAVGGGESDKSMAAIFGYNATTDSWEAMGDMPTARYNVLVAIVNGKLMAVGGRVRWWGPPTDVVEIFC